MGGHRGKPPGWLGAIPRRQPSRRREPYVHPTSRQGEHRLGVPITLGTFAPVVDPGGEGDLNADLRAFLSGAGALERYPSNPTPLMIRSVLIIVVLIALVAGWLVFNGLVRAHPARQRRHAQNYPHIAGDSEVPRLAILLALLLIRSAKPRCRPDRARQVRSSAVIKTTGPGRRQPGAGADHPSASAGSTFERDGVGCSAAPRPLLVTAGSGPGAQSTPSERPDLGGWLELASGLCRYTTSPVRSGSTLPGSSSCR